MSCIIIGSFLSFLKNEKLKDFNNILNYYLHGIITFLIFRRFLVEEKSLLTMNFDKLNHHLYAETIDIEYLKSESGKNLIKNIQNKIFSEFNSISFIFNDKDFEFISFCQFYKLRNLYLSSSNITDKAIEYLIKCDFKHLEELDLQNTKIKDKAIEYLIKCDFKNLQELDLSRTLITDEAIKHLARCNFNKLQALNLGETEITDKAIKYLTRCNFKQIHDIYLWNNKISYKSVRYLIKCNFEELEELYLWGTQIKKVNKLKLKYPKCTFFTNNISKRHCE